MYAIIDKKTDRFAGMIGYLDTVPVNLTTEIGYVFMFVHCLELALSLCPLAYVFFETVYHAYKGRT